MYLVVSRTLFQRLVRLIDLVYLLNSLCIFMLNVAPESLPLVANQVWYYCRHSVQVRIDQ